MDDYFNVFLNNLNTILGEYLDGIEDVDLYLRKLRNGEFFDE